MTPKKLAKIKRELLSMRESPQGYRERDLASLAAQLQRKRKDRGNEPTYVREQNPALSPPLSIPGHGGKELKPGTARNIIDTLLSDVDTWEQYLLEESNEH